MRQQFTQIGTLTALLDDSETAPALGTGQPVSVAVESLSGPLKVITCPDFDVPHFVIGARPASSTSSGIITPISAGVPILLGGAVMRGDKLMVESGRFVKATTGKVVICAAGDAGASGDTIRAALLSEVA